MVLKRGQNEYDLSDPHFPDGMIYNDGPNDLFMAAGLFNQRLYVVPSRETVVVRFGRPDQVKIRGPVATGTLVVESSQPTAAAEWGLGSSRVRHFTCRADFVYWK